MIKNYLQFKLWMFKNLQETSGLSIFLISRDSRCIPIFAYRLLANNLVDFHSISTCVRKRFSKTSHIFTVIFRVDAIEAFPCYSHQTKKLRRWILFFSDAKNFAFFFWKFLSLFLIGPNWNLRCHRFHHGIG